MREEWSSRRSEEGDVREETSGGKETPSGGEEGKGRREEEEEKRRTEDCLLLLLLSIVTFQKVAVRPRPLCSTPGVSGNRSGQVRHRGVRFGVTSSAPCMHISVGLVPGCYLWSLKPWVLSAGFLNASQIADCNFEMCFEATCRPDPLQFNAAEPICV